jgi:hypothetical protein
MEISLRTRYLYKFLKKNNCLREFVINVKKAHPERKYWDVLRILERSGCIGIGFLWSESEEGHEYWEELNKKWGREIKKIED